MDDNIREPSEMTSKRNSGLQRTGAHLIVYYMKFNIPVDIREYLDRIMVKD